MAIHERSTASTRKKPKQLGKLSAAIPRAIRWVDIPHAELYQSVLNSLVLGSRERAKEDALRHVLKPRLPELARSDHRRYVEIECCKIVETLRAVRDEYRRYLEQERCKPIAEMYWVVFRFGIVQYAVRLLRKIASEYVISTKVPFAEWEILYGHSFVPCFPLAGSAKPETPETPTPQSVTNTMRGLIVEDTVRHVGNGGPFGRAGQLELTRRIPGFAFWGPGITFPEIVKKRQLLWEECSTWTKGLSQLFDAAQAELEFQYSLLTEDAKRVESAFVKLSAFEKIAHEYLIDLRQSTASSRNLAESDWLKIMDALDKSGIAVEAELTAGPRKVLATVRRRGHQITTWRECYQSRSHVSMDDGKNHSLRREVTHAIHNAAKRASYQLAKVWSVEG
jgi:hypothetical protein